MIRFNRFNQRAVLCALLLCFNLNASADDMQDANKLIKKGQYPQALSKVQSILQTQPRDAQARFLKGVILSEQGQTEEAIRIFSELTADYPELPEPYNNFAVLYAGQGQFEKAKVALEAAIRTHPSYSTAHENLGDIYAKMASQAYDRALQLDRSNTSSKTKLALIRDLHSPVSKPGSTKIIVAAAVPASSAATTQPPKTENPAPVLLAATPAATVAVTAKPALAPAPVKAAVAEPVGADSEAEVMKAVNNWANAWSARNAALYLALYAKTFEPPNDESRASWEQQRRDRINKPQPISVTISNIKVQIQDGSHATVNFIQFYRSGTLKSTTRKTLEMIKTNGKWLIQSEQTGGRG